MQNSPRSVVIGVLILLALLLSACSGLIAAPTPTLAPTATPDPCSPDNVKVNALKVHQYMRAFDDGAQLASNVQRSQLAAPISNLQGIRRAAEDQPVPSCLLQLKKLELTHMNTTITVLLAFSSGNVTQDQLNQGIGVARQEHDAYTLEFARLLGITPVAAPTLPVASGTQTPGTPQPTLAAGSGIMAQNPGPAPINLLASPAADAAILGVLEVNQSATALAESPDGQWVQVQVPGHDDQTAWVPAANVKLVNQAAP
jgi:hypothetical protein